MTVTRFGNHSACYSARARAKKKTLADMITITKQQLDEFSCELCSWVGPSPVPQRWGGIDICLSCRMRLETTKPAVTIAVPLLIVGKQRARVVTRTGKKTRAFTPARTTRFENDFRLGTSTRMPREPWAGPVRMETTIFVPHSEKRGPHILKPDVDNMLKAILDSCKGRLYHDDCQVWRETTEKLYAKDPLIRMRVYFDSMEGM